MKDMIISEKVREKEILSIEGIADTNAPAEVARISNPVNLAGRYIWAMSDSNLDVAKELELTGIKKYWRRAGQVEMELDWLHNWIPARATFVRHLRRVYNNKEVGQNMWQGSMSREWLALVGKGK